MASDRSIFGYSAQPRWLPLYLLLDCSGSMRGESVEALRECMQILYDGLMQWPDTRHMVKISIVTFSDGAEQTELAPVKSFVPPTITAGGVTRLDGALNLLAQSIEADVRLNTTTAHGDYCPLVFLLTDGVPTDQNGYRSTMYQAELAKIRALRYNHKPMIIALGWGDADEATLREVATRYLIADRDHSSDAVATIRAVFQYIAAFVHGGLRGSEPAPPAGFTVHSGG